MRSLVDEVVAWLIGGAQPLSMKSETKAMDYIVKRLRAFVHSSTTAVSASPNNAAESTAGCVAFGRNNWTFGGSEATADAKLERRRSARPAQRIQ